MRIFNREVKNPIALVTDRFRDDVSVTLTQAGKKRADSMVLDGPKYRVVSELSEQGTLTIEELSKSMGMGSNKVRDILKALIRSGYVKKVSS